MAHSLRFFLPAALTALMLATLLSLGFWQVERLAWKQDLLARIEARQNTAPLTLTKKADLAKLTKQEDEYRRAALVGRFGSQQLFWFTQIENKPMGMPRQDAAGYHVLVPFILRDGGALLVDRGFVPARLKDRPDANPSEMQSYDVILRWPDKRGRFDNQDRPDEGLVYVRDGAAIGSYWRMDLPIVIGEAAETGKHWPWGGQTRMQIANNHLQYAGTWFGLAIVLVIISGLWHIRFWKSRRSAAEPSLGAQIGDD
jgi:surfeit locus 1 family protein